MYESDMDLLVPQAVVSMIRVQGHDATCITIISMQLCMMEVTVPELNLLVLPGFIVGCQFTGVIC